MKTKHDHQSDENCFDGTCDREKNGGIYETKVEHKKLLQTAKELKGQIVKDAEIYAPEGNEPIWAYIADIQNAIVHAGGK